MHRARGNDLDANRGVTPRPYRYKVDYRSNDEWWTWLNASKNNTDLPVDYREAPEAVEFTVFGCSLWILQNASAHHAQHTLRRRSKAQASRQI